MPDDIQDPRPPIQASTIEGKIIKNLRFLQSMIRGEQARFDQFIQSNPQNSSSQENPIEILKQKIISLFVELDIADLASIDIPKKMQQDCFDLISRAWRKIIAERFSQTLTLTRMRFSRESFRAFVAALSFSVSLKALRLDQCHLGIKEAEMLAIFIKVHPSISLLHLNENPFGDEGFEILHYGLTRSDTLIHLSLERISLTDSSIPLIEELLLSPHYQYVSLKNNSFSESNLEKLQKIADEKGIQLVLN